jgi:dCTP deaminase
MPDNVCGVVHDKSSLIRTGIGVHNTFIDPGWRGYLTLEISYHLLNPFKYNSQLHHFSKLLLKPDDEDLNFYTGTPIAQIVFYYLDERTQQPYSGQYQDQETGAQPSKLKTSNPATKIPDELRQIDRFGKVWLGHA